MQQIVYDHLCVLRALLRLVRHQRRFQPPKVDNWFDFISYKYFQVSTAFSVAQKKHVTTILHCTLMMCKREKIFKVSPSSVSSRYY